MKVPISISCAVCGKDLEAKANSLKIQVYPCKACDTYNTVEEEDRVTSDAYEDGCDDGYNQGYGVGYDAGYKVGYDDGYEAKTCDTGW